MRLTRLRARACAPAPFSFTGASVPPAGRAAAFAALAALATACGGDGGSGNEVIVPPDFGSDAPVGGSGPIRDASSDPLDRGGPADRGPPTDGGPADGAAPSDAAAPDPDLSIGDLGVDAADAAPPPPACRNALDDDGDGATDYPTDPGCDGADDPDEADPDQPACADTLDNDDDGLIDVDDPGCAHPGDPNEENTCGPAQTFIDVTGRRRVEGDTTGLPAVFDAGCRTNLAPEAVFLVTLRPGLRAFAADTAGSAFDTVLSIRSACDDLAAETGCNDDVRPGNRTSALRIEAPAPGDHFLVLDGFREESGPFVLNLRAEVEDGDPCPPADAFESCGRGSLCVDGVCARAACFDGVDDDADRRVDFPLDPGCDTPEDDDETDPPTPPACANGQDDDFNGVTDYPDDPGCESAADPTEEPLPDCRNGADDDGDGLIDLADPGCRNDPEWPFEFNTAACRDRQDNDGDGRTDYPFDPGCTSLEDPLEVDPDVSPACADLADNDDDGATDYPADGDGCVSAADPLEAPPCDAVDPEDITGAAETRGDSADGLNEFNGSCNPASGAESVFVWRVTEDRPLTSLRLSTRGSRFDTLLYARTACEPAPGADLACSSFGAADGRAEIVLGAQAPGTDLWIFVDSLSGTPDGVFRLRATVELAQGATCGDADVWTCGPGLFCREGTCQVAACVDGLDNDRDGLTDFPAEPGCEGPEDDDERDPDEPAACSNREDDDGNGYIDYPADPGCAGAGDPDEQAECRDGLDNDGNGATDFDRDGDGFPDFNADPGCACAADPREGADAECADFCDNDGDGLVDLADPGCAGDPAGANEFNVPHCRDGVDNDGDGAVDFPNDPGCPTPETALEDDPAMAPACADGLDNDGDGLIDHASRGAGAGDDGCASAADADELGPCDGPKPELPVTGQARGDSRLFLDEHAGECGFSQGAPDVVFVVPVPFPARVVATTNGSAFDTILYARSACAPALFCPAVPESPDAALDAASDATADATADAAADATADAATPPADAAPAPDAAAPVCVEGSTEVACDDDGGDGVQSQIDVAWPGGPLHVFVDGFGSSAGDYALTVTVTFPAGGACDPDAPAYMRCEEGTACVREADATARCVP
jgi:hypothetical protein